VKQSQNVRASTVSMADSILKAKAEHRRTLKEALQPRKSHEGRATAESLLARALELGLSRFPGVWLSYRGFSSEVRLPNTFVSSLAANSAIQFAYPVLQETDDGMRFYRPGAGGAKFVAGSFGIEAPDLSSDWNLVSADSDASVVGALVPGLGFDRMGGRLGRGRGYYDRFLRETDSHRKAMGLQPLIKIGIGFHEQVVEELPCELHDVKLDAVLTAREWITPVKGAENE
jgi:5-formyltetrahydrofolate cyclo-ligase